MSGKRPARTTPVRRRIARHGFGWGDMTRWANARGYSISTVSNVLTGRLQAFHGINREIARDLDILEEDRPFKPTPFVREPVIFATKREKALHEFRLKGLSVRAWAITNGFNPTLAQHVVAGRRRAIRGQSLEIAIAFGFADREAKNA